MQLPEVVAAGAVRGKDNALPVCRVLRLAIIEGTAGEWHGLRSVIEIQLPEVESAFAIACIDNMATAGMKTWFPGIVVPAGERSCRFFPGLLQIECGLQSNHLVPVDRTDCHREVGSLCQQNRGSRCLGVF